MEPFIKLAEGLSAYNGGQYDGFRIGRVEWQMTGIIQNVIGGIEQEKENYLVIRVTGYGKEQEVSGSLVVTMIKPKVQEQKRDCKALDSTCSVGDEDFAVRQPGECLLTEKQVNAYLHQVRDTNSIHRGKQAVVPGFMLINFMLDLGIFPVQGEEHRIRFRNPLPVGTVFSYISEQNHILITSPQQDVVYAKMN